MTPTRRTGEESSANRTALLDAAQQLMLEEGYAQVTSRRLAARAGLEPQLVHYLFRTMDDLFVALIRRVSEKNLERQARALASPQPLRALWALNSDPTGAALSREFAVLADQRKVIRDELAACADRFRRAQSDALARVLDHHGIDRHAFPAEAVLVLVAAIGQLLVQEESLGLTTGHAEIRTLVERTLARYEGDPPAAEPWPGASAAT